MSDHPAVSFAAWGANAECILRSHSLENSLGDKSPLSRIYDLEGSVLLIGIGYDANTSFHLAEYRASYPSKSFKKCGAPISVNGSRQWRTFDDIELNCDDFLEIGKTFEKSGLEFSKGRVGYAESVLIPQKEMVDFAVGWMNINRG